MRVSGPGERRLHTKSTGDVAFMLRPGAFHAFKFVVPDYHEDAGLKGQFSVVERDANGIEAFVLNEEDYTSWQKGYTTYRYYDSGDVQQGYMDVPLLAWSAGTYYVVFQNRLPAKAPKTIKANLCLTYSTMWWPGMQE